MNLAVVLRPQKVKSGPWERCPAQFNTHKRTVRTWQLKGFNQVCLTFAGLWTLDLGPPGLGTPDLSISNYYVHGHDMFMKLLFS